LALLGLGRACRRPSFLRRQGFLAASSLRRFCPGEHLSL
jgi:hypothetical protein